MPTIIPVDYVQANVVMSLVADPEPMINTFGLHLVDEGVISSTLANSVMTEFSAAFNTTLHNQYTIDQVVLYGFNGLGPSSVTVSTLAPIACTGTNAPLPNNCAHLVRKRTDVAGRRGRGRFYLPSVREDTTNPQGVLDTGYHTGVQSNVDNFFSGINGITGVEDMVVLHRSEGAGVEPPPTPVVSLQVDTKIATQRRRLRP